MSGSTLRAIAHPTCEQVQRAADRAWWVCTGAAVSAFVCHLLWLTPLAPARWFACGSMFLGLLGGEAKRQART